MEPNSVLTEVILTSSRESLGNINLDWTPQPGNYIDLKGKTYAVLERHHRYQLKEGRYCLHKIAIYVQSAKRPDEKTLVNGRWVIGDASCSYNALSEIVRCAVNPVGPCKGCKYFQNYNNGSLDDKS
ncbi:hypothetical protein Riv7116_2532 [Rivularia sp. PCC 7116]|uniref:DUF6464 family protein n=1 Tax=Rivularia sp. PCC 7116 TaxID=373994 RepID=UPI00029F13F8|nr:DUF6464 family protein [Rivularia sp. PCC 7116]AFY55040.1 hypothetical protein Riv7116_2532 [Rivularia sp. PCC 7116]